LSISPNQRIPMKPSSRALLLAAFLLAPLAWQPRQARAQIEWEYTPYSIKVYLAFSRSPEFTPALRSALERDLETWSESWHGAVWTLDAAAPPPELAGDMPLDLALIDLERIEAVDEDALRGDKLLLAAVDAQPAGYRVCVRELDCRTRVWGPVYERRTAQLAAVSRLLFDGLVDCFTPLARVQRAIGRSVELRLRAGGLIVGDSPARVPDDGVFRAVIRRNDRQISLKPEFVEVVPWTWLQSVSRQGASYQCELISGVANALSGRSGRRTEKLALAARRRHPSTRLELVSTGDAPHPLVGYEVFERGVDFAAVERVFKRHCSACHGFKVREADMRLDTHDGVIAGGKNGQVVFAGNSQDSPLIARLLESDPARRMPQDAEPLSAEEIDLIRRWIDGGALQESVPQLVGRSDFSGAVEVAPGDRPVRVLYIKNGAQPLARLPLMPGVEPRQTALLPDDDIRLEAEGAVISIQRSYLDAVTRRQVLAVQIRKQIERRQFEQAERMLDRLRTFESRSDFERRLDLRRREFVASDARTQTRIDQLFGDAQAMINQHLDPALADELTTELVKASGG
jgi:hypothetical protein